MKKILYLLFLSVIIISCNKDDDGAFIEPELIPYLDDFLMEARIRGEIYKRDSLELQMVLVNIPNPGTQGQCIREDGMIHRVEIDKNFFRALDDNKKEFLVFHELGHCILGKGHDDSADGSGNCLSIMQSGGASCTNIYDETTRSGLLDQLFE